MSDNIIPGMLYIEVNGRWHEARLKQKEAWEVFLVNRDKNMSMGMSPEYQLLNCPSNDGTNYAIFDYMYQQNNTFDNIYIQLGDGLLHQILYIQEPSKPKTYQDLNSKTKFQ